MALELLSPAGSPEALRAAVQSGCGAVYLGWGSFNARRSAKNFSDEEFADAIRYCHLRGVRVFLTLNTLLTDRELPLALDAARTACRLGVDSVLVQDWGLFALLREALPDLPLHASTQMSVFTAGGANEVYGDGCERVVIARECSREDTAAICKACPAEIEIFGHGALCMCYSGQCEMSALIGGRSGNRGTCAQPCRLPYGFSGKVDGHPLSLKDANLAPFVPEMMDMGVACLKIEGRMKRPEYVAAVTEMGLGTEAAISAIADFKCGFGRMEQFDLGKAGTKMMLVKNPAGCNQVIEFLENIKEKFILIVCLNDRGADGTDVSWIWDADFEGLAAMSGYIDRVIVSGDRAEDMAVRIKYAGVAGDHISTERDYERLVQWISQQDKPVFIMPTYTAMLALRGTIAKRYGYKEFWQ